MLLAVAALAVVGTPAAAEPGRVAVGIADGIVPETVVAQIEQATGKPVDPTLEELDAVVVSVDDVESAAPVLAALPGVEYVEPMTRSRSLAFVPNDPLAGVQWYLQAIKAFDYWEARPTFGGPVLVAVVDSGIDGDHPEFQGQIAASATFVSSKATVDTAGHGTVVAGEIAAATDNGQGIAGVGFPVKLLVAKVVGGGNDISVEAEAKAIRWAADRGARVINLSLGGVRAPDDPAKDTYSDLEQAAIEYAYGKGAVIVAATGNCEDVCPYNYASYPAALPHVLGTSAIGADDEVAPFSNRDNVYNDIAAPGVGIVSTFPPSLSDPGCAQPGYSLCAPEAYRAGAGTSFAAPLVSAAAALLIAQRPELQPSQVMALLERSAVDLESPGRNSTSGTGRLDIADALTALAALPLPSADADEPNDDAGQSAAILHGSSPHVFATIDYFDDPSDVYRVYLHAGRIVSLSLRGLNGKSTLVLWRPGTVEVSEITLVALRAGSIAAWRRGTAPLIRYRVPKSGWYFAQVQVARGGGGAYELRITKAR